MGFRREYVAVTSLGKCGDQTKPDAALFRIPRYQALNCLRKVACRRWVICVPADRAICLSKMLPFRQLIPCRSRSYISQPKRTHPKRLMSRRARVYQPSGSDCWRLRCNWQLNHSHWPKKDYYSPTVLYLGRLNFSVRPTLLRTEGLRANKPSMNSNL